MTVARFQESATGASIPVSPDNPMPVTGDLTVSTTGLATETTLATGVGHLATLAGAVNTDPVPIIGATAHDAALSTVPVAIAARAATTNPTAVADGDATYIRADKTGRLVVALGQARDLRDSTVTTITASTSATTVAAAQGSGVNSDITSITLTNISATATEVQILDDDGTTVRWAGYAPAGDMRGIVFARPLKAAAANATWKAKTVTSVTSVKITVQFDKEV